MKLGNILDGARRRRPVSRAVKFRVVARNAQAQTTTETAEAVLCLVDDGARQDALVDAQKSLARRFPGVQVPYDVQQSEEAYHFLALALRDRDDPATPFADSVEQLRDALVSREAVRLAAEYGRFVEDEYPEDVDEETFARLVEDAKKNSLSALLTSYGYETIRASLRSLAARLGTQSTPT